MGEANTCMRIHLMSYKLVANTSSVKLVMRKQLKSDML